MDLAKKVNKIIANFPKEERYCLTAQIGFNFISINIWEGT
jgi:hypothetical protein